MLLAWFSPLASCAALVLFWVLVTGERTGHQNLKQGDHAAFAAADRAVKRELNTAAAGAVVTSLTGVVMAVVSLCGLRSAAGVAVVVPGAILGIASAVIVVALVGIYLLLAGMKF